VTAVIGESGDWQAMLDLAPALGGDAGRWRLWLLSDDGSESALAATLPGSRSTDGVMATIPDAPGTSVRYEPVSDEQGLAIDVQSPQPTAWVDHVDNGPGTLSLTLTMRGVRRDAPAVMRAVTSNPSRKVEWPAEISNGVLNTFVPVVELGAELEHGQTAAWTLEVGVDGTVARVGRVGHDIVDLNRTYRFQTQTTRTDGTAVEVRPYFARGQLLRVRVTAGPAALAPADSPSAPNSEEALASAQPSVAVVDRANERLARSLNADWVCAALRSAGVEHLLLPPRPRRSPVVAVREQDKAAVLAALRTSPELSEALIGPAHKGVSLTGQPLAEVDTETLAGVEVVRVYRPVSDTQGRVTIGAAGGCDIEFWATVPDHPANLKAPRPNRLLGKLDTAVFTQLSQRAAAEARTAEAAELAQQLWDEVDFPIDVVFSWVDGEDPAWQAKRDIAMGRNPDERHHQAHGDHRFISRDELRYSLRSIEQFAPWVRNVYLVTDDQRPEWLVDDPSVIQVVDHRDVFTDHSVLPTFNSHAIGSRLHHIDGLSEHFLYFNDDVMLGREVGPDLFFLSNGLSRFFPSSVKVDYSADPEPHEVAGRNIRSLLERDFGRSTAPAMQHTPQALRRSVLEELENRYPEAFATTLASRFRGPSDIAASAFHHYYSYLTGRAVPGQVTYTYVSLAKRSAASQFREILARRAFDVLCVGDAAPVDWSRADQDRAVLSFLETQYPTPSRFERPGTTPTVGSAS
jgi:hypothetical protein